MGRKGKTNLINEISPNKFYADIYARFLEPVQY